MKWIKQRYSNDCGIASLAMLFKTSYKVMRTIILSLAKKHEEDFDGTPKIYARLTGTLMADNLRVWYINDKNRTNLPKRIEHRPAVLIVPAKGISSESGCSLEYHAVYWDGGNTNLVYDPNGDIDPAYCYSQDPKEAFKVVEELWILDSSK